MIHIIPKDNWATVVSDIVENAEQGDTIVCHTVEMLYLAVRAHARLHLSKHIIWEIHKGISE